MVRVVSLAAFPQSEVTRDFYSGIGKVSLMDDRDIRRHLRLKRDRIRKRAKREQADSKKAQEAQD